MSFASISVISLMKASEENVFCSTCRSFCSHSAVIPGDWITSGITVMRAMPLCVGTRYLVFLSPFRSRKPMRTSFSIMPARVAGVPSPFRSASSGVSSAPARSMADNSVLSVKRFFAVVFPSFSWMSLACTVLPSDRRSGSTARSSWMVRLPLPLATASAFPALSSSAAS